MNIKGRYILLSVVEWPVEYKIDDCDTSLLLCIMVFPLSKKKKVMICSILGPLRTLNFIVQH